MRRIKPNKLRSWQMLNEYIQKIWSSIDAEKSMLATAKETTATTTPSGLMYTT
jgi:hypothetical protein